jgi:hypothetical protein
LHQSKFRIGWRRQLKIGNMMMRIRINSYINLPHTSFLFNLQSSLLTFVHTPTSLYITTWLQYLSSVQCIISYSRVDALER